MELKTKYQYSYFIYPYSIKESRYEKYLLKLLNNKRCKVQFMQKEKDMEIYTYFLPTIRKFMFQDFQYNDEKIRRFSEFSKKVQATILSKQGCTIFNYEINQGLQGKAGQREGIFFYINKISIICFNTGVCFICIKTNLQDTNNFSDVLNFNYKFKDISSEINKLKEYENIKIQASTFSDTKKINELIREITGTKIENKQINIDANTLYTYSYVCIEPNYWNEEQSFSNIEHDFQKYANILPSSHQSNFENKEIKTLSNSKYIKIAFTKLGTTLLTTGIDTYNYTKLPDSYEKQYFYTYILSLYKKIYLKKIESQFKNILKTREARQKFVTFTKDIWIQEITNEDEGSQVYKEYKKVLELEKTYNSIKNKYDIAYKELNIEKESKVNKFILILLIISLLLNIINFAVLRKMSN